MLSEDRDNLSPPILLPPPIDAPPPISLPPPIYIPKVMEATPVIKYKPRTYGKRADYKKELAFYQTVEEKLLKEWDTTTDKPLVERKLLAAAKALTSIRLPKTEDKYTEWSLQQRHRLETGYDWHCSRRLIEILGDYRTTQQYDKDIERLIRLDQQDEKFEQQHAKDKS